MRAPANTILCAALIAAVLTPLVGGCDGGGGGGTDPGGGPGPHPITPVAYEVYEGQTATIRVQRMSGDAGPVSVRYEVLDGTAVAPADYGAPSSSGTLSWPSGTSGPLSFTIATVDDGMAEGPETVRIRLSSPTGGAAIVTAETTLTVRDPPQRDVLQFSAAEYTAHERLGTSTATITVHRLDPGAGTVTVAYGVASGGTATAGADFGTPSGTGTLTWPGYDGSPRTFTVPVFDDGGPDEGVETVRFALSSPTGGAVLGSPSTATLSVVDGAGTIRFGSPTYTVSEGGAALVTLERVGGARGTVTASYAVAPGTASISDYTASSVPTPVTWTDGDMSTKSFVVLTSNDTPGDEPDETVLLSLTGDVSSPSTATVTIQDHPGTIAFPYARLGVYEAAVTVLVPVRRTGGSRGAVSVACATSNGSALAGTNYVAATATLSWASGDMSEKICPVQVLDDGVSGNGDRTLNLALSGLTGPATLGSQAAATLTIMDGPGWFWFVP